MERKTIHIAVSGHTNTGKTTLIRTLMRSDIGEVSDKANVTQVSKPYYYHALQATFIDTPGFQQASTLALFYDIQENDPKIDIDKIPGEWEKKLKYDKEALKAVKISDAVIYVATLTQVPDNSYKEELHLIKKIQPKVIGVLNQEKKEFNSYIQQGINQGTAKSNLNNRITLWKEFFKELHIETVVIFDAHGDKPAKINEIYDGIFKILNPESQKRFQEGLNLFKIREDYISDEALTLLVSTICYCQQNSKVTVKKNEYVEQKVREQMESAFLNANIDFLNKITKLYNIAAENPSATKEQLKFKIKESIDLGSRTTNSALGATLLGGTSAVVGAAMVGLIAGIFSGGAALGAGALFGAQIAGSIGAAIGGVSLALSDYEDNVEIKVESDEIRQIFALNLAALWGISNVGFGRNRELAQGEIEKIKNEILKSQWFLPIDWTSANKEMIIYHSRTLLKELEG